MNKDRCPCGGVIFADTEDWETPLCFLCFVDSGNEGKNWQVSMNTKYFNQLKDNLKQHAAKQATTAEGIDNPGCYQLGFSDAISALDGVLEALCIISRDFGTDYCDGNTMIAKSAIDKLNKKLEAP